MELSGARSHWGIWVAVLPILIWAVVRVLGVHGGFPLIPLLAYTPYVAFAAILVAGIALALRNWAAAAVAALAAACLVSVVLPRALGHGEEAPPGASELRVLSSNVALGGADWWQLLNLVEATDADVLFVQELTPGFELELEVGGIDKILPYSIVAARKGASGGGIYSRLPMRRIPAPAGVGFRMPRGIVTLADGSRARIVDVHPYPPKRDLVERWRTQLATLPAGDRGGPPWVLAGDFNATLDFPEMNDLIGSGYRDAGDVTGEGLEPTWPSGEIYPPPVTIDHVLADRRVAILGYGVDEMPGSDHRAISARLAIP